MIKYYKAFLKQYFLTERKQWDIFSHFEPLISKNDA